MKPRILLFLLIIFIIPFTFVSETDTQVTVVPGAPLRFKVCVYVESQDDTDLDERLESFVRRELRALSDVDLVKKDSDWIYLLAYDILEHSFKDGTKSDYVSIAVVVLSAVVVGYDPEIDPYDDRFGRPGYLDSIRSAHWTADNLHQYAIENVGNFDKVRLEPLRRE